jgi:hypothetical protein
MSLTAAMFCDKPKIVNKSRRVGSKEKSAAFSARTAVIRTMTAKNRFTIIIKFSTGVGMGSINKNTIISTIRIGENFAIIPLKENFLSINTLLLLFNLALYISHWSIRR